jgi:hypothetical protein
LGADVYNCGVFACTNALLLAFGYNLKCFTARELDQFRKKRMVAELRNGGFSGLYNYDLLEFPPPREVSGPSTDWEKLKEIIDGEEGNDVNDDDDSDGDDQRGFEDDTILDTTSKIATLSPKILFPTASQCLARDMASAIIGPESIVRPPTPQFFGSVAGQSQRYRFMYSFPHINFAEAVQASKEDMIEACKNFPLANWEHWSYHPKEYFLRWMMTEMGATMARIHKDQIQPCPGLGDGYKIWLKWELEKKKLGEVKDAQNFLEQTEELDAAEMESLPVKLEAPNALRRSSRTASIRKATE